MKPFLQSTLVLLVPLILLPGCSLMNAGEPSKPLHFYTIGPLPEKSDASSANQPQNNEKRISLVVSQFEGSGIYSKSPMVWKQQQHLQRFKYNRWANPPTRMLQSVVVQLLRRESPEDNIWIHSATSDLEDGQFQVRGTLNNLYLKRMKNAWEVVLKLDLMLIRRTSDQALPDQSVSPEDIKGSWLLNATGRADAPKTEQETPSTMNELLTDLNEDLSDQGGEIARSILQRVDRLLNTPSDHEENNSDESADGK